MKPQSGQAYKAYRDNICDPKPKYHLYLDDDIVFLINSDPDLFDFNIPLKKEDSIILTKDCYLQTKQIFKYDDRFKVIKISDMSSDVLIKLSNFLKDDNLSKRLPRIFIERAIGIIEKSLFERQK